MHQKKGKPPFSPYSCAVAANGGGYIGHKCMRKYLEVLVDEDGRFHFSTDEPFNGILSPQVFDREFHQLLHDMTEFMWQNQDQKVSQAVRMVAMAEMLGCAQPYEQAEDFWSMMMFDTIPHYEGYAANIKKPYGFDNRVVTRPTVLAPGSPLFPIKQPFGKKSS
jgi:hypothetical protein